MIISFVNQKGGVGKTTAAINLAISLRKKNYSLVFIDADPQGSAVQWHAIEGKFSKNMGKPRKSLDMAYLACYSFLHEHNNPNGEYL
jgi:cellulose biosynthesis protein BcsQ